MMGGMGIGWILGLVFIAVVVWAIVSLVGTGQGVRPSSRKGAMEILKERYARGEIDKDEFERMKRELA